jgi:hypothetical protein
MSAVERGRGGEHQSRPGDAAASREPAEALALAARAAHAALADPGVDATRQGGDIIMQDGQVLQI